ncbi:putative ferric-chelate reductase 1 [Bufo gargarizans]|uniref:putative ferric-chelate reductase 1 n=1 Tax=Bufo gargarizans TaxID=30331 RepID=UPI001CF35C02|nr:putative ferric-chelate reductase 1 [Bufo gargarizans]
MEHFRTFLFCLAGCLVTVFGYPSGQISPSCDSMLPSHGNSAPQSSESPYIITVSKTTFLPGDIITVTISKKSSASSSFKGFLLQARLVGGNRITGTFQPSDSGVAQTLTCGSQASAAVSHTNDNFKESVTAQWTAPEGAGPVRFRATVLLSYDTFWTGVESDIIEALKMSNTPCGSQKFCLSDPTNCSPDDNNCLFMSAVPANVGYVFEMSGPTTGYVAIGFSDDQEMGNDDFYICTTNSTGSILVQRANTTGTVAPTLRNISIAGSIVSSYKDGVLKCSIITAESILLQQRSSGNPTYYIFLVSGPSSADGQIQKNTKELITDSKIDLRSFLATVAESGESKVVLGHGALMLIAWMTTGTIGMMMARYMKSAAGKPFLGKAAWFQVHLILMILTVILTIIAFIMVFADVREWSGGAHPVLGCIVMILSFFQPIAAFFRPDPKHERRFIFNWGHSINALVIKILAVAAIFLGFNRMISPRPWLPQVMGGFFAWEVLFYIILEINTLLRTKDIYENVNRKIPVEILALNIFIIGNLAFLIALLVGIGQSA